MEDKAIRLASDPTLDPSDGDTSSVLRLEQDILGPLSDSRRFFVYETRDFWRQIKTAGSAVPANALYLQKAWQSESNELSQPSAFIVPPVYVHPTAVVDPTAKLGPNVSIGPRAVIGAGARLKESIVLEDAEIKHDACILYSIIGWQSKVGAWARVEGTPMSVTEHSTTVVKNGVRVQSVSILSRDCKVGDEVRVWNCVTLPFKELKRVFISPSVPPLNSVLIYFLGCFQRSHHVILLLNELTMKFLTEKGQNMSQKNHCFLYLVCNEILSSLSS